MVYLRINTEIHFHRWSMHNTLIQITLYYRRDALIAMNIRSEDIDGVLTLCNGFKFVAVCLSLDMYVSQLNHVAEMLFLHPKQQLIGKLFHDICSNLGVVSPIARAATPKTLAQPSMPTMHLLSNKNIANVHWSISCILDEDKYTGYVLVGKLIVACAPTPPLMAIENIIRKFPGAIFTKDMEGYCSFANAYQAKILGFSSERYLIGQSDYDAPWSAQADIIRQADQQVIEEDRTIVFEEYGTLASGKIEGFLVTKSPFKDEHGNLLGIIGTSISITHERQKLFSSDPPGFLNNLDVNASTIYLSKKEIECVNWMIKGKSSSEIAGILGISKRTVETHMNNIKKKLNCYKQFQVGYLLGKYGHLLI